MNVINDNATIFANNGMDLENATHYIPLGNRLIGKLITDPSKEVTLKSGIILPNDVTGGSKDPYTIVKILKVGRGTITHNSIVPCEAQPGDIALLFNAKWYVLKNKTNGEEVIIFSENDIVAIQHRDEQKA